MAGTAPGSPLGLGDLVTGTEQVGTFIYLVATGTWWLSLAAYVLLGLMPGTEVTTQLLLSFKHPEDLAPTTEWLATVLVAGETFCFQRRIVDTAGRLHSIVVVGGTTSNEAGQVERIGGFALDLTASQARFARRAGTLAVQSATRPSQSVEQAKGAVMLAYGISPDAAAAVLRWHAQEHDVRLNLLADRLVVRLRGSALASSGTRGTVDRALHDAARNGRGDDEQL